MSLIKGICLMEMCILYGMVWTSLPAGWSLVAGIGVGVTFCWFGVREPQS